MKDFKTYTIRQEELMNRTSEYTGTVSTKTPKKKAQQKQDTLVSRNQMNESFNSMDRLTQLDFISSCVDSVRTHL